MAREMITTLLDVLALLIIAAGAGLAIIIGVEWLGLVLSGVVTGAGSLVFEWLAHPAAAPRWWRRRMSGESA